MSKQEIQPEISHVLGLTKQENKIMWAISDVAMQVSTVARVTNLPRTSLLYILRNLEKRSLVGRSKNGKYTYWKSNAISTFKVFENSTTNVVVYNGLKDIFTIFDKLTELPIHARVQGLQPDKSIMMLLKKMPLERAIGINKKIKSRKIIMEGIVHEQTPNSVLDRFGKKYAEALFNSFIGRLEDYVKIPDDFADVESEIYIFGGSAYIINWDKEIALEISNKDMVGLLTAMFSCVKELGIRYSQNKKMEATLPNTLR